MSFPLSHSHRGHWQETEGCLVQMETGLERKKALHQTRLELDPQILMVVTRTNRFSSDSEVPDLEKSLQ